MDRKFSDITSFLPSNVLLATILPFIKHLRMIRFFSFGRNRENGAGFLLQLNMSLIGHYRTWDQSLKARLSEYFFYLQTSVRHFFQTCTKVLSLY